MAESAIEKVILGSLIHNPHYYPVVLPHAKEEFFDDDAVKTVFRLSSEYFEKFGCMPTREAIEVELETAKGLNEEVFQKSSALVGTLFKEGVKENLNSQTLDWLLDKTERHFKDRASFIAVMEALEILDGKSKLSRDYIPTLLEKAISISFSSDIGHDYLDNWEQRYQEFHKKIDKIPFSLFMLNKVTDGGHERKSLSLFVAGTNVGKTMLLTNEAAHLLTIGKNVLYITLEMSEIKISERVDAKLMQVPMAGVRKMDFESYKSRILGIKGRATGRLKIKEFPPRTITVKHIESLLNELKSSCSFVPDVICVDYLTLLNSYTLKGGGHENLYILGKLVAEELRALAIRFNVSTLSASQTNRNGQRDTDFDITDLGESHAISQTADFMVGLISTEELEKIGQMKLKLLKSRFGPLNEPNSFIVGIDRARMSLFDVDYKVDTSDNNTSAPTPHITEGAKPNVSAFKF